MALVLVHDEVLGAHQHAARPLVAARHAHEMVRCRVHRIGPLAHDVVETEVQLVEDKVLLIEHLVGVLVILDLLGVHLDRRKDRVVEADVDANYVERDRARLMRLERRGDGEARGRVAIEDVHELLFLRRRDHQRTPSRIRRDELARHDPPDPRLAVRLAVDALEACPFGRELEDHDLARVGAHHQVVAVPAGEPKRRDRADDAEDLGRVDRLHLVVLVGSQQLQDLATSDCQLLHLWP
mmetsp:Transcript_21443/g.46107  ORF Transcript_21443/g.46107 Transcript_21443/m.46107 type:complete len:239 (-) Transcript_21443:160-876(-)